MGFPNDKQLSWLSCSSLWNLCRPAATREFITMNVANLLWDVVKYHSSSKKVVQCAIGALSNIAIVERFQPMMLKPERLALLSSIWDMYRDSSTVVTPACGLIANLAISDDSEDLLIEHGFIPRLLFGTKMFPNDDIRRNCSAALSNLSHGESFKKAVVESSGISALYTMFEESHESPQIAQLLLNAMNVIGLAPEQKVNSLHVASRDFDVGVVSNLLEECDGQIQGTDQNGQTPLDYAIQAEKLGVVSLLAMAGAQRGNVEGTLSTEVKMALSSGYEVFTKTKATFVNSIAEAMPTLPVDLACEMVKFVPGEELHFSSCQNDDDHAMAIDE